MIHRKCWNSKYWNFYFSFIVVLKAHNLLFVIWHKMLSEFRSCVCVRRKRLFIHKIGWKRNEGFYSPSAVAFVPYCDEILYAILAVSIKNCTLRMECIKPVSVIHDVIIFYQFPEAFFSSKNNLFFIYDNFGI